MPRPRRATSIPSKKRGALVASVQPTSAWARTQSYPRFDWEAQVKGGSGWQTHTVSIDNGSDFDLVSARVVHQLGLRPTGERLDSEIQFGQGSGYSAATYLITIRLPDSTGRTETFTRRCYAIETDAFDVLLGLP